MGTSKNKTSAKQQKRVKVGKLRATKELSAKDARRVKGGTDFNFVHTYDKSTPVLLTDPKR